MLFKKSAKEISQKIFDKVLITGADGMVGSYLDFGLRFGRSQLDVASLEQVMETVQKYKPKIILHLAALTNLESCEENPALAYMVNAVGTYNMVLAARAVGAKLIYVSTDGVFDGLRAEPYRVSDVPNPQTVYGHSKYLGELAVSGLLKDYAIIRTCWIFGGGREKDKKFVGKIIEKINLGDLEIKAPMDQFGSPTYAKDLAAAIVRVISGQMRGVFHIVNQGSCSRAQEAEEIVKIINPKVQVVPVPAATFGLKAGRLHEALEPSPDILKSWQAALKEYLTTEW